MSSVSVARAQSLRLLNFGTRTITVISRHKHLTTKTNINLRNFSCLGQVKLPLAPVKAKDTVASILSPQHLNRSFRYVTI